MTAANVKKALDRAVEPGRKAKNEWFFKSGEGHYSEGDQFIGVRVPAARAIAKQHKTIPFNEVKALLGSPIHEHRLTGAILLTYKYNKSTTQAVYDFYIEQVRHNTTVQIGPDFKAYGPRRGIDNWDIVDCSAHKIAGQYLASQTDRSTLYELANHDGLWQNRVSMVATWWLINKKHDYADALVLAEYFMDHPHDLMHKAAGWMLREIGKQDLGPLRVFLDGNVKKMPRTMLRYAIERMPESERRTYLATR